MVSPLTVIVAPFFAVPMMGLPVIGLKSCSLRPRESKSAWFIQLEYVFPLSAISANSTSPILDFKYALYVGRFVSMRQITDNLSRSLNSESLPTSTPILLLWANHLFKVSVLGGAALMQTDFRRVVLLLDCGRRSSMPSAFLSFPN